MRQANRIIVNALSNYAMTFVTMIVSLILVREVVQCLSRSGFGLAALVLIPCVIFQLLSNSIGRGLHRHIPQELAGDDPSRARCLLNGALLYYALLGMIGAGLLLWLRGYLVAGRDVEAALQADGRLAVWLLIAWFAIAAPGLAYTRGLEALQRYDLVSAFQGGGAILRAVVVIVIFRLGHGSVSVYVGSQLLLTLLVALLCRRSLLRYIPPLASSRRWVDGRSMYLLGTFALGVLLVICGNILGNEAFRFFVGMRLGMHELGALAAVLTLTAMVGRFINNLTNVFVPAVSTMEARGSVGSVAKLLATGTKYSVVVATSMCLIPVTVAGAFVGLWLGDEFTDLDALLYVVLLAQIPMSLGGSSVYVLIGLGKLQLAAPIMFARGAVGLLAAIAYVIFIDRSVIGAVACTFGTQAIGSLVMLWYGFSVTNLPKLRTFWEAVLRPLGMGVAGALATWVTASWVDARHWPGLIGSVCVGEVVFLGSVLLGGLTAEERSRLRSFLVSSRARLATTPRPLQGGQGKP